MSQSSSDSQSSVDSEEYSCHFCNTILCITNNECSICNQCEHTLCFYCSDQCSLCNECNCPEHIYECAICSETVCNDCWYIKCSICDQIMCINCFNIDLMWTKYADNICKDCASSDIEPYKNLRLMDKSDIDIITNK